MANSFILYILAYFLVHIPAQFFTYLIASVFDVPTKFSYFKLGFPIPDHSYLWTSDSVAAIYITAPIIALFIAIFVARYYVLFSAKKSINFNLLLIWIYAHCINLFFGGLTIGIPLIKGFGYVPNWLYASDELSFFFILISLLILFGNGFILKTSFSSFYFDHQYFNSPFHSLLFKIFVAFVPFVMANIFFFLIQFPDNSIYERLIGVTMIIQLIGILPFSPVYQPVEFDFKPVSFVYKGLLLLIVIFLALFLWKTMHNQFFYKNAENSEMIQNAE